MNSYVKTFLLIALTIPILLSTLIIVSSSVEARGTTLASDDDTFEITNKSFVEVDSNSLSCSPERRILNTGKCEVQAFEASQSGQQKSITFVNGKTYVMSVEVEDTSGQGRFAISQGEYGIRVGAINLPCSSQEDLRSKESNCWREAGDTNWDGSGDNLIHGHNPKNFLSIGNDKCKCIDSSGVGCREIKCFSDEFTGNVPKLDNTRSNTLGITVLVDSKKPCTSNTQCHNNGVLDPIDGGYIETCQKVDRCTTGSGCDQKFCVGEQFQCPTGNGNTKNNPKGIETIQDLKDINNARYKHYSLCNNIDLSSESNWDPINTFSGSFNGNGFTISNLNVNSGNLTGLFGFISGAEIERLRLTDIDVVGESGSHSVGGVVGQAVGSNISHVFVSGNITGHSDFGLLAGYVLSDSIVNFSSTSGIVKGLSQGPFRGGGLIGTVWDSTVNSSASFTKLDITPSGSGNIGWFGGLIGYAKNSNVSDSYTQSHIYVSRGGVGIGGLVGEMNNSRIKNSYSSSSLDLSNANDDDGGLVGKKINGGSCSNSYYNEDNACKLDRTSCGTGKNSSEFKRPTSSTGIYSSWSSNLWDFGTESNHPKLKDIQLSNSKVRSPQDQGCSSSEEEEEDSGPDRRVGDRTCLSDGRPGIWDGSAWERQSACADDEVCRDGSCKCRGNLIKIGGICKPPECTSNPGCEYDEECVNGRCQELSCRTDRHCSGSFKVTPGTGSDRYVNHGCKYYYASCGVASRCFISSPNSHFCGCLSDSGCSGSLRCNTITHLCE